MARALGVDRDDQVLIDEHVKVEGREAALGPR
jgi:hypothetical protein